MELRDLYDKNGKVADKTYYKGDIIPNGYYPMVVMVVIRNSENKFLMQKRVPSKGGDWGVTGGHPKSGETPIEGIITEVKEELGLDFSNEKFIEFDSGCDGNDCYKMYLVNKDINLDDIVIEKTELSEVKWFSMEELENMVKNGELNENQISCFNKVCKYLEKVNNIEVKRKDMKRSDWFRCLEKDYSYEEFRFDKFSGIVSSSKLKKLTGPLIIHYEMGDVLLADNNYTWLQLAFRNECFWLTAMYDDKDNLIELYFDITKGNFFEEEDNPYFYDMFLDVVVTNDGKIVVLDEDELKIALDNNIISNNEYDKANNIALELVNYLEKNKDKLIEYCYQLLQEMK